MMTLEEALRPSEAAPAVAPTAVGATPRVRGGVPLDQRLAWQAPQRLPRSKQERCVICVSVTRRCAAFADAATTNAAEVNIITLTTLASAPLSGFSRMRGKSKDSSFAKTRTCSTA